LIGVTGEAIAAKAYFDGDLDALVNAYLSATGRTASQWDLFAQALEEERFDDAERIWDYGA
jgi:hypothetical protein